MPNDVSLPLGMWTSLYWDLPAEEALRRVAGHGWHYVDLSAEHLGELTRANDARRVERVRQLAQSLGINLWQCHGYMDLKLAARDEGLRGRSEAALAEHLRLAERLGVGAVVVHPATDGAASDEAAESERVRNCMAEVLGRLLPLARQTGVRIAVENPMRKGFGVQPADLVALAEALDPRCVGICFDTSHANGGGVDSAQGIRACGPHLFALHLSDNDGSGDQHRPPFFGTVQWPAVLSAIRDVGFAGPLSFEVPYLSRWPLPVRDAIFPFIEAAMRYAAAPGEADSASAREAMQTVTRRGRLEG